MRAFNGVDPENQPASKQIDEDVSQSAGQFAKRYARNVRKERSLGMQNAKATLRTASIVRGPSSSGWLCRLMRLLFLRHWDYDGDNFESPA